MSKKVSTLDRRITIVSDTVSGTGPYTHTIVTGTHYLNTNDVVQITTYNKSDLVNKSASVTVTNGTTFTISLTENVGSLTGDIVIPYYSAGMTGVQGSVSWPQQGTPGVIQIVATGAATIAIEGSLNNTDFVNIGTSTLGAAGTDYLIVDAAWAYIRPNITSIAATKLARIYRSV